MGVLDRFRQRNPGHAEAILEPLIAQLEAQQRGAVSERRAQLIAERRERLARAEGEVGRCEAEAKAAQTAWDAAQPLRQRAILAQWALMTAQSGRGGGSAVELLERELRATKLSAVADLEADLDALLQAVSDRGFAVGPVAEADAYPEERRATQDEGRARLMAIRAARRECAELELVDDLTAAEQVAEIRAQLAPDLDRFLAETGRRAGQ